MATKLLYRVNEFCEAVSISRTSFYRFVTAGKINVVKVATGTRVPAAELDRFVSELAEGA